MSEDGCFEGSHVLVWGSFFAVGVDDMKRLRSGEFLNDTLVDVQELELQSRLSQSVQARCGASLHHMCAARCRRVAAAGSAIAASPCLRLRNATAVLIRFEGLSHGPRG